MELNRETQPVAAKAAAAFGLACVAMNFGIMTHFATHKPELVQMERAPSEEVRQAIAEIAWRREDLADANVATVRTNTPELRTHHASGDSAFRTHRWRSGELARRVACARRMERRHNNSPQTLTTMQTFTRQMRSSSHTLTRFSALQALRKIPASGGDGGGAHATIELTKRYSFLK